MTRARMAAAVGVVALSVLLIAGVILANTSRTPQIGPIGPQPIPATALGWYVASPSTQSDATLSGLTNEGDGPLTLRSVSFARVSPGVRFLGAFIARDATASLSQAHYDDFPPLEGLEPLEGATIAPGEAFTLALGFEVSDGDVNGAEDLDLRYTVDGIEMRTPIAHRVVMCPLPVGEPCAGDQAVPGL